VCALKNESGLGLLGKPLEKKRTMLSTARWCGSDSDVSMRVLNQINGILNIR